MKNKFSKTLSIGLIISLIVLMQLSLVQAKKPEGTPITMQFWGDTFTQHQRVEVNKFRFIDWSMSGPMSPQSIISGTFVWSDSTTIKFYSDAFERIQFERHSIEIVITGNIDGKSGTITIHSNIYFTYTYGGLDPYDIVHGNWKIVSGTDGFSELKGNGELTFWEVYQFDGIIYGL